SPAWPRGPRPGDCPRGVAVRAMAGGCPRRGRWGHGCASGLRRELAPVALEPRELRSPPAGVRGATVPDEPRDVGRDGVDDRLDDPLVALDAVGLAEDADPSRLLDRRRA